MWWLPTSRKHWPLSRVLWRPTPGELALQATCGSAALRPHLVQQGHAAGPLARLFAGGEQQVIPQSHAQLQSTQAKRRDDVQVASSDSLEGHEGLLPPQGQLDLASRLPTLSQSSHRRKRMTMKNSCRYYKIYNKMIIR